MKNSWTKIRIWCMCATMFTGSLVIVNLTTSFTATLIVNIVCTIVNVANWAYCRTKEVAMQKDIDFINKWERFYELYTLYEAEKAKEEVFK